MCNLLCEQRKKEKKVFHDEHFREMKCTVHIISRSSVQTLAGLNLWVRSTSLGVVLGLTLNQMPVHESI